MTQFLWILVATLGASLVIQAALLRRTFRHRLAVQAAVLQRSQHAMNGKLDKTKRQIGQLQIDLSAARLQLKQLGRPTASAPASAVARQALERELDDASTSRQTLPVDGFADTQPAPHNTQFGSLLLQ